MNLTFQNCPIRTSAILAALVLTASVASAQMVTHFAGPTAGGGASDGQGVAAHFGILDQIAVDLAGNVIAPDPENNTVRRVSPSGAVTTLAGLAGAAGDSDGSGAKARFRTPVCAAVDLHGNIFVGDEASNVIRKITPSGEVTTFAGTINQFGDDDGPGSTAKFGFIESLATDGAGNVYVADSGTNKIRRVTPAGVVSTLAGTGQTGSADGPGRVAQFNGPLGICVDGAGNIYVSDASNFTIRKITPDGTVATLAGTPGVSGDDDATGSAASFGRPRQIAVDGNGNLYLTDDFNDSVRKITPEGVVTTINALFTLLRPEGIAINGAGALYLSDDLQVSTMPGSGGTPTVIAGSEPIFGSADATGSDARFNAPVDVAFDHNGNLFVADQANSRIRKIDPTGAVTTFAGSYLGDQDGTGTAAVLGQPNGLTFDSHGNLFFTDRVSQTIRKATPAGVVATIAGAGEMSGSADGTGAAAQFFDPEGIVVDGSGNIYVVDTGNNTIRKIDPNLSVTTLAGMAGQQGSVDGSGNSARFTRPTRIAIGPGGNLYVADVHRIRIVTPAGDVTTMPLIEGTGNVGILTDIDGIVFDRDGNIFTTDQENGQIEKIIRGVVTFPLGRFDVYGTTDGEGLASRFAFGGLEGMAIDGNGVIYVADGNNNGIRAIGADLGDRATIDLPAGKSGKVGTIRQLDTAPQNATTWQWSIFRQPSGSTAALSSTTLRNPTFNPDVTGLYIFQVVATKGVLKSVSTVNLDVQGERSRPVRLP